MSEQPLPNAPEARTPTGEILDQSLTPAPTPTPEPTPTPTPELTPTDDGTTLLTKKEGEEAKPAEGAPEAYAAFKLPENFKLEGEQLEAATELFKDLNLTQAGAQSLVDYHAAQLQAAATNAANAGTETMNTMRAEWQKEVNENAKLGPRLKEIKVNVSRALDSLENPALATRFKQAMDLTGVGDHPAFVEAFDAFAKVINEGKPVKGGGPSVHGQTPGGNAPKPTAAQALYPGLASAASSS